MKLNINRRITVDGPTITHEASWDHFRRYLSGKGWEKRLETDRDDAGEDLDGVVEQWNEGGGPNSAWVHIWRDITSAVRDRACMKNAVERIAMAEQRPAHLVLADVSSSTADVRR